MLLSKQDASAAEGDPAPPRHEEAYRRIEQLRQVQHVVALRRIQRR